MGRTHRVIALIVDGEPGDPSATPVFPTGAAIKIDADGKITDEREEPIAADVRPQGGQQAYRITEDGRRSAWPRP